MCIIKEIGRFISQGACTFRDAAAGRYEHTSPSLEEIKREIFSRKSDRLEDKANLIEDRKNIEKNVRKSFDELVLNHG